MGILTLNSVLCKWLCIPVSHLCWQEETHLKRKLLGNGMGEVGRTNPNMAVFQNKKMKPATHTHTQGRRKHEPDEATVQTVKKRVWQYKFQSVCINQDFKIALFGMMK